MQLLDLFLSSHLVPRCCFFFIKLCTYERGKLFPLHPLVIIVIIFSKNFNSNLKASHICTFCTLLSKIVFRKLNGTKKMVVSAWQRFKKISVVNYEQIFLKKS